MSRAGFLSVALVSLIGIVGCSKSDRTGMRAADQSAGRPAAVGTGGAGADVRSDPEFVHDIAMKNLAEIELSRLALQRAVNPDVKSFAQMMVDDHSAAGSKLRSVVPPDAIGWPDRLDDKHSEVVAELSAKRGAEFDREYAEAMVESHQNLAAKLESRLDVQSLADWKTAAAARTQGKGLPDPTTHMSDVEIRPANSANDVTRKINHWAAETYPVAQKHLDAARTLENATKKR
jgi:putative membrane protein